MHVKSKWDDETLKVSKSKSKIKILKKALDDAGKSGKMLGVNDIWQSGKDVHTVWASLSNQRRTVKIFEILTFEAKNIAIHF